MEPFWQEDEIGVVCFPLQKINSTSLNMYGTQLQNSAYNKTFF